MAFRGDFEPTEHAYAHRFRVQAADIDELGHANNVVWLRWVNDAARAHSEAVGFGREGLLQLSVLWVVRRHDLEYLLPAFEGDDVEALTWARTLSGATSERRTLFKLAGKVAARADTKWVMIDAVTRGPVRIPAPILAAYGF